MLKVGKFHGRNESKKKLAWTTEAQVVRHTFQQGLFDQFSHFLVHLDKGFVLRTDAPGYARGAVLQ